jgi:protein-L-isoaspartate(D-aspartate) O-methyltransferase
METTGDKWLVRRLQMVQRDLRARGIADEAVLSAFMEIPRERFLPESCLAEAYDDHPLPIGHGQTISQPLVVAMMVRELRCQPHHRVLDVGAGSGYQTAILSRLVSHVFAVERINELTEQAIDALASIGVDNVTVCTTDGTLGLPEEAPFDGIICGAAAPDVPPSWRDQIADGGRIVLPVGDRHEQMLIVIQRSGDAFTRREVCPVRFVKLIGQEGWRDPE